MTNEQKAMGRLGATFLKCVSCQGTFAYREDSPQVYVFIDGELSCGPDVLCCSHECADTWASDYNNSTERTMESEHREAVVSREMP